MRTFTSEKIALLNKKGEALQEMILQMSDEELLNLCPSPSSKTMQKLKSKLVVNSKVLSSRN
jgi:hypothetical protein